MNRKLTGLSRKYQAALRKPLSKIPRRVCRHAGTGTPGHDPGLETLDLARIHEQALIALVLPRYSHGTRESLVRRAGAFFAGVITPLERTHHTAPDQSLPVQTNNALRQRTVRLLVLSNRQLKLEIPRRRLAEESLRKSEQHYCRLLQQSRQMQERLRLLSRQVLSAQEEERKKISRDLHDVIAQTLTGINVRLGP